MTNEIAQLQAESATGKIHHLNATKEEKSKILQEMSNEIKSAEESLGVIRQEIKSVEDEKAEFLAKMNEYQREKSQSDKQLADAMRSYEETRAILAVTKKRISQIGERTNELQVQSQTMTNLKVDAESNAKISHESLEKLKLEQNRINEKVAASDEMSEMKIRQRQSSESEKQVDAKLQEMTLHLHDERASEKNPNQINSLQFEIHLFEALYLDIQKIFLSLVSAQTSCKWIFPNCKPQKLRMQMQRFT